MTQSVPLGRPSAPTRAHAMERTVARAKDGDREALAQLYARYAASLRGYVRGIVRDEHEAEDITQQVFAKLMTVLDRYDRREVPFSAWLMRLAHNAAIDHVRARRGLVGAIPAVSDPRSDETHADRSRSLQDALAALPREQRSVVVLRHVLGLSPAEIAERLGRTESAVHGLHHRGRRALRTELLRHGSGPCTASSGRAA